VTPLPGASSSSDASAVAAVSSSGVVTGLAEGSATITAAASGLTANLTAGSTFVSSSPGVATVSAAGLVTAVGVGTTMMWLFLQTLELGGRSSQFGSSWTSSTDQFP
jgi:uncharacterized protein YjdB